MAHHPNLKKTVETDGLQQLKGRSMLLPAPWHLKKDEGDAPAITPARVLAIFLGLLFPTKVLGVGMISQFCKGDLGDSAAIHGYTT